MYSRVIPGFLEDETRRRLATLADLSLDGWVRGRQETGYEKLAIPIGAVPPWLDQLTMSSLAALATPSPPIGWDRYLLRYELGASVPPHIDPPLSEGRNHVRLNAVIRQSIRGGVLVLDGEEIALSEGDAVVFRPDLQSHAVTTIDDGSRLLWSIGCNF